jgi:hypothetical protein
VGTGGGVRCLRVAGGIMELTLCFSGVQGSSLGVEVLHGPCLAETIKPVV